MAKEALSGAKLKKVLAALEGNWQAEMEGYHTYQALADRDTDPVRAQVLRHLAGAEWEHAALWAGRIEELGQPVPIYTGRAHGEADSLANRAGGIRMALRRLEIEESRDIATLRNPVEGVGRRGIHRHPRPRHRGRKGSLPGARIAACAATTRRPPARTKSKPRRFWRRCWPSATRAASSPAAWIGDAIYGVNDGLGAIFGIVSGVSGATAGDSKYVLLAGLSGMIASALSMGSGAYLAAKSEREIYHAEIIREREAIQMNGPEARELLSLYYQVKGLPEEDAQNMVNHIASDPEQLLRALASERLGTSEEALANPLVSAGSGALSTAIGAAIPIIPFFFMSGIDAVIAAAVISLAAHFAVGAAKSAHHRPLLVVLGYGNDRRRRNRRRRHLRHRHPAG